MGFASVALALQKNMAQRNSGQTKPVRVTSASRAAPVDEDLRFQKRQWLAERIGWTVMAALLVGAAAGLFGGAGPLARATAASADGAVGVEYARFARHHAPTTLDVNLAHVPAAGQIRIRVSKDYLDAMEVRSILPHPATSALAEKQYVFVFDRPAQAGAARVRLQLEPSTPGPTSGWIAVNDGAPILFRQFVYP
jgi:hypothetical protein